MLVILVFLGICGWYFYSSFFPNGIPKSLREDTASEREEDKDEEEKEAMMKEDEPAADGEAGEDKK